MANGYGKGWVTGDCIRSHPYVTPESRENFDRIFKHGNHKDDTTGAPTNPRDNSEQASLPEWRQVSKGTSGASGGSSVCPLGYRSRDIPVVGNSIGE